MSEMAVVTQALGKSFGGAWAVRDLDCHIPQGAVYGLLGRNEAGKTTMLALLAGLLHPSEGQIEIFGHTRPAERRLLAADIAYVDDAKTVYGHLTVRQMVEFARSLAPRWSEALAAKYLRHVPAGQRIRRLSRGERAQLAFAVAAARRPKLLLLDEPGANLDVIAAQEMFRGLIGDCVSEGATVVVASHELEEMAQVCDHIGILQAGRLKCECSIEELEVNYRVLTSVDQPPDLTGLTEIVSARKVDGASRYLINGNLQHVISGLKSRGVTILNVQPASLRTLYLELLDRSPAGVESH